MDNQKKIIIIGGNSILAKYLAPSLCQKHEVITFGRKNCDYFLDVTSDLDIFLFPAQFDTAIYVAAGFSEKDDCEVLNTININVLGALKACMASYSQGINHFIFISSIYVTLPNEHPYSTLYSLSKKQAEEIIEQYCTKHKIKLTILRPSPIYDSYSLCRPHQGLLYRIIDYAENERDIIFYGSHDAVRNYIFMDDLVKIISNVVEDSYEGIFNCASPQNIRVTEIAHISKKACQSCSKVIFMPEKQDIPDTIFNIDNRLYDLMKYKPETSLEVGIHNIYTARKKVLSC